MRKITFELSDCDSIMIIEISDYFDLYMDVSKQGKAGRILDYNERLFTWIRRTEDGQEQRTDEIKTTIEIREILKNYVGRDMTL